MDRSLVLVWAWYKLRSHVSKTKKLGVDKGRCGAFDESAPNPNFWSLRSWARSYRISPEMKGLPPPLRHVAGTFLSAMAQNDNGCGLIQLIIIWYTKYDI